MKDENDWYKIIKHMRLIKMKKKYKILIIKISNNFKIKELMTKFKANRQLLRLIHLQIYINHYHMVTHNSIYKKIK